MKRRIIVQTATGKVLEARPPNWEKLEKQEAKRLRMAQRWVDRLSKRLSSKM